MEGSVIYQEACAAGDPAGYVERLDEQELKRLHRHCDRLMDTNDSRGGIPAVVLWLAKLEAAKRFLG
jgi:hypothetical protein